MHTDKKYSSIITRDEIHVEMSVVSEVSVWIGKMSQ